ncbi:MAG: hypothetical protein ACI8S6_002686 [Myxococcota bacterium]|jgi:hypothetical protein
MTLYDVLAVIVIVLGSGAAAWLLRSPARVLLTAADPLLEQLSAVLSLELAEDGLHGTTDGSPVELRVHTTRSGYQIEAIVPIRGRMPVGFLVSRRDPRLQRGAPLGVPGLDRWLQVYTSDTRIPDDLSWLAGQTMPLGDVATPPGAVRFLSEESVAAALGALLPPEREGSRVNAAAVTLLELGDAPEVAEALLADAARLAQAIEQAADPWRMTAEALSLSADPYDEHGDRALRGIRDGRQIRATTCTDEDGVIESVEVTVTPVRAGVTIRSGSGGLTLHNPILDQRLFVEASDPDTLRARLDVPEATADLMEVFGTWPDAVLEDGTLRVRANDMIDAEALIDMIEAALRCAARVG